MSIQETLYDIVNYFHKDKTLNRLTGSLNPKSFFFKWRITDIFTLIILGVIYVVTYNDKPFERQFYVNDITISHPFAEKERVSGSQLFLYALWFPLTLLVSVSLVITRPKYKMYVMYTSVIGLLLSVATTSVFTDIIKNQIGRHRPDFLARCVPKDGTPKNVLVYAKDVCTTDNMSRLYDGFRTTPSGHSSLSFAGLSYSSLWLAGQLVAGNDSVGSWRTIISFIPTLGAAFIALSRTQDYRHHFVDVFIGSLIGLVAAFWSYYRLFPSLKNRKSYYPIFTLKEQQDELTEENRSRSNHLQPTHSDVSYSVISDTV
ncbi:diacylglycerol pyrophosphate phosphatase [Scheffersomyces stipitis CBS 6054]|uniref:Diacylglycerol pyrophosphate phosphatase n=1 Tax=Scheffersomyces stipitis (strain ATCC 58785 / CBS 6054 / NBRC 10063 / NRRL Y-11545) TaxID=322104 RepID=A3LWJ3_PICST|nr:diacylglycerol pyrophosphate phosphatase [Scheffersomyces stipitis CBS 6054]ABN67288.1 diacylglycerol pyrophosphate phosphatase [Scheffersomyces stipitis CBS 6054]